MKKLSKLFNEFEMQRESLFFVKGGLRKGGCTESPSQHDTAGGGCDGDTEPDPDVDTAAAVQVTVKF